MAGNTRGKIKEHFEGLHRNHDWIEHHCDTLITLIAGQKPNLTEAIQAYHAQIKVLDELVQGLYATI